MQHRSRRARQHAVGPAASVVAVEEVDLPVAGDGEVLVELVAAPINPAELLMLEGLYGYRDTVPALPRDLGIEGVGRVIGGATDIVPVGTLVSLIGANGILGDHTVLAADQVVRVPDDVDAETFAVAFVNVQSVLLMLSEWSELERGDWVVQNAGNSGYGRILDAIAARRGLRVVNVVRSDRARDEITGSARGAVVVDDRDLETAVLEATDGARPRVAVDAVGGDATSRLAATLEAGGRVVTYGLLSGDPCRLDARLVVFNGIRLEGFWMPRSIAAADPTTLRSLTSDAIDVLRSGDVRVPIAARYGLDEISTAVTRAAGGGRGGKILVTQ